MTTNHTPDQILEAYFRGCDGSTPPSLRMVTHADASQAFIDSREVNADLLAALKECYAAANSIDIHASTALWRVREAARAAIARAKGE